MCASTWNVTLFAEKFWKKCLSRHFCVRCISHETHGSVKNFYLYLSGHLNCVPLPVFFYCDIRLVGGPATVLYSLAPFFFFIISFVLAILCLLFHGSKSCSKQFQHNCILLVLNEPHSGALKKRYVETGFYCWLIPDQKEVNFLLNSLLCLNVPVGGHCGSCVNARATRDCEQFFCSGWPKGAPCGPLWKRIWTCVKDRATAQTKENEIFYYC